MATLPHRVCSLTKFYRAAQLFSAWLLLGSGCASRVYRPAELPAELLAPVTENVQEANLGKLATYAVNSQLIDRGDVLEVTIVTNFGDLQSTTTPVRVRENGMAKVPWVEEIALAGLELEEAEQAVAAALIAHGVFRQPHVTVTMKQQRKNLVTVIGAVEEPGVYELPRRSSTLLAALVSAGGLSEEAGSEVEIRRPAPLGTIPGPQPWNRPRVAAGVGAELTSYEAPGRQTGVPEVSRVNLTTAAAEGRGGRHLEDGDVVVVSKRAPKPIAVMGLVSKPDVYELPANQDLCLLDALAKAGDRTLTVADKVIIRRQLPGQPRPVVINVSVRKAQSHAADNVRLAPGDVIIVEDTPLTFVVRGLREITRVTLGGSYGLF